MKKLEKLSINPEKVIKNEELVDLKGGYGGSWYVKCYDGGGGLLGDLCSSPDASIVEECQEHWPNTYYYEATYNSSQCN